MLFFEQYVYTDFVTMKRYLSPASRVDPITPDAWLATRTFSTSNARTLSSAQVPGDATVMLGSGGANTGDALSLDATK